MPIDNNKELWRQILKNLQPRVREHDFLTWFRNTCVLEFDDGSGVLKVGLPSEIVKTTVLAKHHLGLLDAAQEVSLKIRGIEYEVDGSLKDAKCDRVVSLARVMTDKRRVDRREQVSGKVVSESVTSRELNSRYTFDNFVVGSESRLAHAAFIAAASRPGKNYNPLFVYSGVGLGKTHLLQAAGNEILSRNKKAIVSYTTSEKFASDLIHSIQGGIRKIEKFREHYRRVDVLIIDDIQFLAGKERTQEEFFHTFNVLAEAGKQIILSSDRQPHEIQNLDARLVSRFNSGMIVDIGEPVFETRLAILQKKCSERGVLIGSDILEYIAYNVRHSVREIEGLLTQVIARMDLMPEVPPSIEMVAEILRKTSCVKVLVDSQDALPNRSAITSEDIIKKVSDHFHVNVSQITGSSRKQEVAEARQVAMFLIRNELRYSLERIGRDFGGKNHATALYSFRKINEALKLHPTSALARDVAVIKRSIVEN